MQANDLVIHTTDRGEGPVFDRFFAGYDRAFVLPDEKEDVEGFRACLALNHGAEHATLTAEYGPFRELCLVADTADGTPAGGANLIAMPLHDDAGTPIVTVNLNYVYVDPESRGRGYLGRLVAAATRCAAGLFTPAPLPVLVFIEQNDPFRMSEESYALDTRFTGLDQLDRLKIWARLGAKALDFPYRQPALSAAQEPDDSLLMSVLGAPGEALGSDLLAAHLRCFFGISVLKGAPIGEDAGASAQLAVLAGAPPVRLFDARALLASFDSRDAIAARLGRRPSSMREALAGLAALTRRE